MEISYEPINILFLEIINFITKMRHKGVKITRSKYNYINDIYQRYFYNPRN